MADLKPSQKGQVKSFKTQVLGILASQNMRAYLDRSKLYANILLEVDYDPQVKQWVNKYRIFQHIVMGTSFKLSVFIYLFIWGFTSLSTLYRSYHDG